MRERVYFDWNATSPLRPEAEAAVGAALRRVGNPSSVHTEGRSARHAIEEARSQVAILVAAEPANVIFTSGGTEANALALRPDIQIGATPTRFDVLLTSEIEHPSVLCGGAFPSDRVLRFRVHENGVADLAHLKHQLDACASQGMRPLVSLMLANNETGVLQPIREAAEIVHAADGLLHVDAVQGPSLIRVDINDLGADLLTLSGHKIGAPTGVGALVRRDRALHFPQALIRGGGQERGLRAGTENVLGIIGMGAAAQAACIALVTEGPRLLVLRDQAIAGLRQACPEGVVIGEAAPRLPNTVLFAAPGLRVETALMALDLEGVAASAGAACSSGKVARSHVLQAMRVPAQLANAAIRLSFGYSTTANEIEQLVSAWKTVVRTLLKAGRDIAA
jgi:cysteine desulfurase